MIIVAELKKPFTPEERAEFMQQYCFNSAFQIIADKKGNLQAWDYTEEEKQAKENEEIDQLTMTALDFINCLRSYGISLQDIYDFLDNNLELKTQLTYCQNVYCGVVVPLLPIKINGIEVTAEMVRASFKAKYEREAM